MRLEQRVAAALVVALGLALPASAAAPPPLPPLGLTPDKTTRLLVVSPHPDDESLAAAGLIARVVARGGAVRVVLMTSGDAFAEGVETEDGISRPTPADYRNYGTLRERETSAALQRLGLDRTHVTFLGFPDDGLCQLASTYLSVEDRVRVAVHRGAKARPRPNRSFAVWATAARTCGARSSASSSSSARPSSCCRIPRTSTRTIARRTSSSPRRSTPPCASVASSGRRSIHYLIHYGQWPMSADAGAGSQLNPPAGFPAAEGRWTTLKLTAEEAATKKQALLAYSSQMLVIGRFMLAFGRGQRALPRGRAGVAARVLVQRHKRRDRAAARQAAAAPQAAAMTTARHRLASLDAFRGLAIAGMILVNNPGSWNAVFPPLAHADWNGCTFADLVFPAFIFILGAAMPFAFSRRLASGHETAAMYRRIVRRSASLVGLGLVLNAVAASPAVNALRIPGVLQRIGLVYLATAFILLHADAGRRAAIAIALVGRPLGAPRAGALRRPRRRHAHARGQPGGLPRSAGVRDAHAECVRRSRRAARHAAGGGDGARRARSRASGCATRRARGAGSSASSRAGRSAWRPGSRGRSRCRSTRPSGPARTRSSRPGSRRSAFAACYWLVDVEAVDAWARPFIWLGRESAGDLLSRPSSRAICSIARGCASPARRWT